MDRVYQILLTAVLALTIGIFAGLYGARVSEHIPIDWVGTISSAKDITTILGLVLAGVWTAFLIQRRRSLEPRASITHRWQIWYQGADRMLRMFVEVSNPSEVVIRPGDGETRIQQPPTGSFSSHEFAPDTWVDIEKIRHCLGYEDVYIEPKESETFAHDVRLPIGVRYLQIATEMACVRTKDMKVDRALGRPTAALDLPKDADRWTLTTLIDLNEPNSKTALDNCTLREIPNRADEPTSHNASVPEER
jgi:hypothetical protein